MKYFGDFSLLIRPSLIIPALTVVFGLLLTIINATRTVDSSLSKSDIQRLQQIFSEGIKSNDLQSIYYSVINSNAIPAEAKANLCRRLSEIYSESKLNDFEKNFYYIGASITLLCSEKIPVNIITQLKSSFDKEFVSTQELFYNYFAQKSLDPSFFQTPIKEKLAKNLQVLLKKDDSLQSLGYGFFLASELGPAGAFAIDRIEDAIAQADEVDGRMLQFEGGLSITSLVINGAFKVTTANAKPIPLNNEQTKKFASYLLSRRSVTTAKGASLLLESLKLIMAQKSVAPIAIRIADNGQLTPIAPVLKLRISDLLGEVLKEKPASVKVTITAKGSSTKVVDGESLAPVAADATLYKLDMTSKKLPKGQYKVEVVAGDFKQTNLAITVLGKVRLDKVDVSISESDSQTSTKKVSLEKTNKFPEMYTLDHQQKINLRFDLFDDQTNIVMSVHQAFVRFTDKSGAEIIFIAEQDVAKAYKFEMDVGLRAGDFGAKSGVYSVDLIIGDASLVNSFVRSLGDITLKFSLESKKDSSTAAQLRQARPEIHHMFREPEKRPPRFVSDLFTGFCLAPILVLFILWGRLGINTSNFCLSVSALGFHGGLAAIFSLFVYFWLKLDMFQTIKYLIPLATFTFLCGNVVLRYIASKRLEKQQDKN